MLSRTHTGSCLLMMLWAGISLGWASPAAADDYLHSIVINEILSENASTVFNEALGEYSDWIELYNAGDDVFDLSGYFLTDDLQEPTKSRIPDGVTIAPGAYLLIWADGHPELGPDHASFRLDNDGEEVGLYAPLGMGNGLIDGRHFPALGADQSYGRSCDAFIGWRKFTEATPLAANPGECIFVCTEADLNDDRALNYLDISIFMQAIAANDPLADLTDDGVINFFDVSTFLSFYTAGCRAQ